MRIRFVEGIKAMFDEQVTAIGENAERKGTASPSRGEEAVVRHL